MTPEKPLRDDFPSMPPLPSADDIERFCRAASNGDNETVGGMLDRFGGVIINARDNIEACALTWAAWGGKTETVRLLLDRGANIEAPGTDDRTAVCWAADMGRADTLLLLLERGADPAARDALGLNAWDLAKKADHPHITAALDGWLREKQLQEEREKEAKIRGIISARQAQLRQSRPPGLALKRKPDVSGPEGGSGL